MTKRVVILHDKIEGRKRAFKNVVSLYQATGDKILGISLGALYNALSAHNGVYENKVVKIEYTCIESNHETWE